MNKDNTDINIKQEMLKNANIQYNIIELPDVNLILYTYESDKIKTEIKAPTKIRNVKKSDNEEVSYTSVTNNKNVNKVHTYIINAFFEQRSNIITIPLADFISIGIFKNEKTTRRNLEAIMWYLMSIKLSIKDKTRKDKDISLTNIIYKSDIKNGMLIVKLDEDYYNNILEVFTRIPNWAYKASSKTFNLICKVLEYERVNRRKGNEVKTNE